MGQAWMKDEFIDNFFKIWGKCAQKIFQTQGGDIPNSR